MTDLMTANQDLDDRLREITATVLGIDFDALSDDSSPKSVATWTSIRHLSLIAAIEEGFAIQFSVDEIHQAQSFSDLRRIVAAHAHGRSR